ncbi:MAG: E3 binding domain-containing protein, partial [Halioglobus sp.]|nr:E3 binding domain-containing protein [Halioglobus sp.]
MAIEIKAPMFPESVADGEVAAWHKSEGESVSRDELIVEIETDKVVLEVVAPEDGVISAIHVQAGETIQSEQLLATMEAGAVSRQPAEKTDASAETAPAASAGEDAAATPGPAARQLIEEHGLDVRQIAASGKGGRVTKDDVLKHLKEREAAAPAPAKQASAPAAEATPAPSSERVERRVPMTRMRAKIAERLLHATQETAMLTTFNEVN